MNRIDDDEYESYLTPVDKAYLKKFRLPEYISRFVSENNNQDLFNLLLIICRLPSAEFCSEYYEYQSIIFKELSILGLIISSGKLDIQYFENYEVNSEKIKFICNCFDSKINYLNLGIDETDDHCTRRSTANALKGVIHYLCLYNPGIYEAKNSISMEALEAIQSPINDNRISEKAPKNLDKIKALKHFAPELWEKLQRSQNKTIQQDVIHLITGVNKEDSYKYSFGDRQKQMELREIHSLTDLITKLTQ